MPLLSSKINEVFNKYKLAYLLVLIISAIICTVGIKKAYDAANYNKYIIKHNEYIDEYNKSTDEINRDIANSNSDLTGDFDIEDFFYGYRDDYIEFADKVPSAFIITLGLILLIITFVSYMSQKRWSLLMSIITSVFINLSLLYQMFIVLNESQLRSEILSAYILMLSGLFIASSINADHLSKMQDHKNKALWVKINQNPTERDNTLFKAGCAIAAAVMGLSFKLPFFSINIWGMSESFSIMDVSDFMNDYFGYGEGTGLVALARVALGMLVFYIAVLFLLSFSNSKAKKVMMGITVALSIYTIVFGTQTIIRRAIEDMVNWGYARADDFGIVGFITNSIFGVFGSIFRLEFGVIVLICALVAYILFASCQFSRIGKPKFALPNGMVMQTAPVIKLRCGECNSLNDDTATFCSGCGKPLVKAQEPKPLLAISACNKCGAKLEENVKFCNICGTPKSQDTDSGKIETKNCTSCNAELNITMKFCDKCGANIQYN